MLTIQRVSGHDWTDHAHVVKTIIVCVLQLQAQIQVVFYNIWPHFTLDTMVYP